MKFFRQSFRPLPMHVQAAQNQNQIIMGYGLALGGAALFSTKGVFIKLAYGVSDDLAPITLLAIRMGLAVPIYVVIALWALRVRARRETSENIPKITVRHYLGAGASGLLGYYLASVLDFTGLVYITAQLERLILFTYPAFVMILGALFFKKRIRVSGVFSMLIAYGGLALIFARGSIANGEQVILGSVLVFSAAFVFAIFQLIAGAQIKTIGGALFTCAAMIFAGVGILAHFVIESIIIGGFSRLNQPKEVWFLGVGIAVVGTLVPSFLINIALGRIGAQAVAVVSMVSPLATICLAVTLLGEPFGMVDGFGTALAIFGIGLFTWFDRKPQLTK